MRKLILFNLVTLDGYFEGPGGDIDWHQVDEEFNTFAVEQLDSSGGLVFGRVTYEGMASYWPTPEAAASDPAVASRMNALPKYVFSRTLDSVEWQNSYLVKGDDAGALSRLKQQPGKDLLLFGSGKLAATFANYGLIDEYRLIVVPVILGNGTPMFGGVTQKQPLKLVNSRVFHNGNVLLYYRPQKS